ncbi:unnamed protein product [Auanema sp. JU1783]|nr:unnamed protein product [Auanema sp. JU1783]
MSLVRYVGQIRRRLRYLLTFLIALTLTASLAYNKGKQYSPTTYESKIINIAQAPAGKSLGYPSIQEYVGEFDTADLYKSVLVSQHGSENHKPRDHSHEKLKVFLLPFTHVDPGWLRTFDSYSDDTNKILTNMHNFMTKNPKMTFMWAEFVFFERWWNLQNITVKTDVRKLVQDGRLEMASGSWVMTDEANAYFPVSVDNIVEGQQFLRNEFDIQPTVIWSNDPFGYSNSVPYLFREAGIKRNVINRIHHSLKRKLQSNRAIPFNWRQYFDKQGEMDVLTHVLPYTHYDILNSCGPDPSRCCEFDFKRMTHWYCPGGRPEPITNSNVAKKAKTLVDQLKKMSEMYEAPVLLMMHGDDFRFDMIEEWHQHHDNFLPLFEEINKNHNVEIKFGTFSEYFESLENWYSTNSKTPAVLTGDFFPYQCALGDQWTGYFTTRPFYKRQGRLLHSLIRAADIAMANFEKKLKPDLAKSSYSSLQVARRTLSLFQHHDAITGTSKQHVMENYSQLLQEGLNLTKSVLEGCLEHAVGSVVTLAQFPNSFRNTQTKVSLSMSKVENGFVVLYNSLPYKLQDTVSVRVDVPFVRVEYNGKAVPAQIEPFVYLGEIAQKSFLLTFPVEIDSFATASFKLTHDRNSGSTQIAQVLTTGAHVSKLKIALPKIFTLTEILEEQFHLNTRHIKTSHDVVTGLVKSVELIGKFEQKFNTSFVSYDSHGGAYLMRVNGPPKNFLNTPMPKLLVKGAIQQSVHLFSKELYKRIVAKEFSGSMTPQLEYHIRMDIKHLRNQEVAMRIETNWENSKFYSDSVGMQLMRRTNYSTLSVQANYYPMPTAAVLDDGAQRLTVASNVEHGVMPLNNGMEIMIDRILNQDDGKGLGSEADSLPLDLYPVDMQFSLLFEDYIKKEVNSNAGSHYTAHSPAGLLSVQNLLYPPITTLSIEKPFDVVNDFELLPCDYQLLTIRDIGLGKKLLTIFRNGLAEGFATPAECGVQSTTALRQFLERIGVRKVKKSNLSGTDDTADEISVKQLIVNLEPFRFLSLIVS